MSFFAVFALVVAVFGDRFLGAVLVRVVPPFSLFPSIIRNNFPSTPFCAVNFPPLLVAVPISHFVSFFTRLFQIFLVRLGNFETKGYFENHFVTGNKPKPFSFENLMRRCTRQVQFCQVVVCDSSFVAQFNGESNHVSFAVEAYQYRAKIQKT
jgi:hypothetical protein